MIEDALVWLQQADPSAVYGFLFLMAFLENVFPPIPGDLPVAFIGSLIHLSPISFAGALVSASFWVHSRVHAAVSSQPSFRHQALC